MRLKIIFLIFVLFLLIGAGCEESDDAKKEKSSEEINTEDRESEFYDDLDDSFNELDELEEEI